MSDDFEATFVVDLAPPAVWRALTERIASSDDDATHLVIAGFPSFPPAPLPGAACTVIQEVPELLLRVSKDDHPCAGTEIAITLEQVSTGTRVTVVQSGFGPFLDLAGRDTVIAHGEQIVRDLQLFLERGVTVVGTSWGTPLGARPVQTPTGLELEQVDVGGFAERAGLEVRDLLLTVAGIRIHDIAQLWTTLSLVDATEPVPLSWARGGEVLTGSAVPAP